MNLVHWNSLHPKNSILPTLLGQTPHFLCENHKASTNNLHHWIVMQPSAQLHSFVQFYSCTVVQSSVHCCPCRIYFSLLSPYPIVSRTGQSQGLLYKQPYLKECYVVGSILVLASPHQGYPCHCYTLQGLDGIAPKTTGS